MIFFLVIILLAILAFSARADEKPIRKEDISVALVVVLVTLGLLGLGKIIQAFL
ncbi:MAG: hypothetical protein R3B47_09065 [Bacteroidia bacterium]